MRLRFSDNFSLLVLKVRKVTGSFPLGELFSTLLSLFVPAPDDLRDTLKDHVSEIMSCYHRVDIPCLIDLVTAVLLKVASDVAKERNVEKCGRNQKQEGAGEDKGGEKCRECEGGGNDSISPEVFGEVVPFTPVVLLRLVDSVQGQSINGLARPIGQKNTFPALKCEENKESDAVTAFRRFPNVIEETEVIV